MSGWFSSVLFFCFLPFAKFTRKNVKCTIQLWHGTLNRCTRNYFCYSFYKMYKMSQKVDFKCQYQKPKKVCKRTNTALTMMKTHKTMCIWEATMPKLRYIKKPYCPTKQTQYVNFRLVVNYNTSTLDNFWRNSQMISPCLTKVFL